LVEFSINKGNQGGRVVKRICELNFWKIVSSRSPLSSIALFALMAVGAAWAQEAPQVLTASGQLRGVVRRGGGAEFLGIPYAQPPLGELRWHEPVPAKPWSRVRDVNAFGAPCAQPVLGDWNPHDAETGKEDCLFLNVITPVWPKKEPLPVMLWFHGGGNEGGTASSALYKDGTLAGHGVLLVTVNYRLGIFGFFAHPGLTQESAHHASGNYGLMDQMLALRWVRDNIARFGGDPNNITVFGQSAGAVDIGLLMTSPAKDLFQKAIEESGASFSLPLPPLASTEKAGEIFALAVNVPAGIDTLVYLRQLSAEQLLAALKSQSPHPHFGPIIDGWVVPRSPAEVFATGQQAAIPLLFGTTARELGAAVFAIPASADQLRKTISERDGNFAPQALAAYGLAGDGMGATDTLYGPVADQWAGDLVFRCPAAAQGNWHSAAHHPTYEYEFDHAIPGQEAQGAIHGADLPYVFGYFPKTGNIAGSFGDVDLKLADLMESYWTNFAKTGNPNGAGLPDWPQFGSAQAFIQFTQDGHVANASRLRAAQCDVYREAMAERMKRKP
jgi:para-nitrobenzyl esterase